MKTDQQKMILITGSNGQLGKELQVVSLKYPEYHFIFGTRTDYNVGNKDIIDKVVALRPNYIINCAAYTAVDKAEGEVNESFAANADACKWLTEAAQNIGACIIHISSDYVYHIEKWGVLSESDVPNPQSVYSTSKYKGEEYVRNYPKHIILRTSWVYSAYGNNFVKTMLKLGNIKNELTIVHDQIGAPTYAADLATAILQIIDQIENSNKQDDLYGTYNYSNEGAISWLDFAAAIFEEADLKVTLSPTTTALYNAPAPRPLWSVMSKSKIKNAFKLDIPHWRDGLRRCLIVVANQSL